MHLFCGAVQTQAQTAAEALRLTAQDMQELGVIDQIVEEPVGGAHRDIDAALKNLADAIDSQLMNPVRVKHRSVES